MILLLSGSRHARSLDDPRSTDRPPKFSLWPPIFLISPYGVDRTRGRWPPKGRTFHKGQRSSQHTTNIYLHSDSRFVTKDCKIYILSFVLTFSVIKSCILSLRCTDCDYVPKCWTDEQEMEFVLDFPPLYTLRALFLHHRSRSARPTVKRTTVRPSPHLICPCDFHWRRPFRRAVQWARKAGGCWYCSVFIDLQRYRSC